MLLVDPMHVLRLRVLEKRTSHRLASVWCEADDFTPARRGQRTALCVSDMGTLQRKWRGGGTGEVAHLEGRRGAEPISTVSLARPGWREVLLAAHQVSGVMEI